MSKHTPNWTEAKTYPWSSVVGCGLVLHDVTGKVVAQLGIRLLDKDEAVALSEQIADMMNSHRHLIAALVTARAAIAPDDLGGISLQQWNERLKGASKIIDRALAQASGQ